MGKRDYAREKVSTSYDDDGGAAESGGVGRVAGAVGSEGERGVEGVGGDGGFEGGFGRRRSGGGERKVCEG